MAAVLAVPGASDVVHLNVIKAVAWAYVTGGLGVVAALALAAIGWTMAGIAHP
ncbi:hypothetical protein ACIQ7Q_21775 [Streptomyces sp. NPDC096176]|uniref:hypothetical protein n=1 Tax=Streptomyces sp. NPDC096176 TaxID=3366079 RepID=UPI0038144FA0